MPRLFDRLALPHSARRLAGSLGLALSTLPAWDLRIETLLDRIETEQ